MQLTVGEKESDTETTPAAMQLTVGPPDRREIRDWASDTHTLACGNSATVQVIPSETPAEELVIDDTSERNIMARASNTTHDRHRIVLGIDGEIMATDDNYQDRVDGKNVAGYPSLIDAPIRELYDYGPVDRVEQARKMANVLADVIVQQDLAVKIGKGKHVTVGGWSLLGTMAGCLPRERQVIERENGDFEAFVEVVRVRDGVVVGGGSAICGHDEAVWASRPRNARRSMAVTRATGKAFRISFGWVMGLAGYSETPAEEMEVVRGEVEHKKKTDPTDEQLRYAASWMRLVDAACGDAAVSEKGAEDCIKEVISLGRQLDAFISDGRLVSAQRSDLAAHATAAWKALKALRALQADT